MLIEPLSDEQLNRVYSDLLSPLSWDLGHIANFEELWLVQRVGGAEPMDGELGRLYDAIENPRAIRNELPILRGDDLRAYMAEVRKRTLDVLDGIDLSDPADPLLADGFIYEMLIAHEHQHNETMLQLLQMVERYEPVERDPEPASEPVAEGPKTVSVAGGMVEIGAGREGFAYDNERPRHTVELEPFEIDRVPVTNGEFARFVAETGAEPPMYWEPDGAGGWVRAAMGSGPSSIRASGRPRRLAPGRRLRPLVRWAPADRARVGGGGGRGLSRARQPRPARLRDRPRRRLRRRALGLRRGADARRCLGVDLVGLHGLPGVRGVPIPRVLGGLLRRRVQGPPRRRLGDPARGDPARAFAIGTCRSDDRSSPGYAA